MLSHVGSIGSQIVPQTMLSHVGSVGSQIVPQTMLSQVGSVRSHSGAGPHPMPVQFKSVGSHGIGIGYVSVVPHTMLSPQSTVAQTVPHTMF